MYLKISTSQLVLFKTEYICYLIKLDLQIDFLFDQKSTKGLKYFDFICDILHTWQFHHIISVDTNIIYIMIYIFLSLSQRNTASTILSDKFLIYSP